MVHMLVVLHMGAGACIIMCSNLWYSEGICILSYCLGSQHCNISMNKFLKNDSYLTAFWYLSLPVHL